MITSQELQQALQGMVPTGQQANAAQLARALIAAVQGEPLAEEFTKTPDMKYLLEVLAGKEASNGQTLISFGKENAIGDVQFQDVAGNNIIKISINFYHDGSINRPLPTVDPSRPGDQTAVKIASLVEKLDRITIYQLLTQHFSNEEINGLCYTLNIDHETFPTSSKDGKARELIRYAERHGRYHELVKQIFTLRPHLLQSY
ncbi:hypothetical protein K2Z83_11085 [Oscillochloris sp. ZM17-4]|uniref:hypothetical protein n=1 Tax=Oscillochloris sp. ZM17-4 TaxID=2866714 RepID=UPI001C733AB9|nr:hypothetical protein [Oscillochloris sp. ZM17-4]MBX0328220.1 hypothetical protein [Oscillochloris sp. ZM17-4]